MALFFYVDPGASKRIPSSCHYSSRLHPLGNDYDTAITYRLPLLIYLIVRPLRSMMRAPFSHRKAVW
jgi:hypothetical protein